MNTNPKIEWEALEYKEDLKGTDWFWALGIIVITGSIIAFIYENYFFAGILLLGGIMLGLTVNKKPEMLSYTLDEKGIKIKNALYPFDRISEFSVYKDRPILVIRSERMMFPIISMPIPEDEKENIREIFLAKNVKESEITEHTADKIVRFLGI